eukprot:765791-Hanusia_phi.AAC.9
MIELSCLPQGIPPPASGACRRPAQVRVVRRGLDGTRSGRLLHLGARAAYHVGEAGAVRSDDLDTIVSLRWSEDREVGYGICVSKESELRGEGDVFTVLPHVARDKPAPLSSACQLLPRCREWQRTSCQQELVVVQDAASSTLALEQ